uniref:TSA: Wollemia nobilis Ref_Wollemi_Transcript_13542_1689 transcribed RNA sequence n=1 Tax=Wollemia nobilis TaxID=56998 RepID=A0A0C9QQW9_9CONI
MKQSEILACQIQEWYPSFNSVSLKTIVIPLPEPFIEYLLDDGGLFLPKTASDEDALPSRVKVTWPDLQAEDYHRWKEEDDEEEETAQNVAAFPNLEEAVRAAIQKLGGSAFPKMNWSAPKDAVWISTNGSLKCCLFGEIVLLLRASDSIVHDLCHAFESCEDKSSDRPSQFYLALRKWYDLRPEMEFRGFVKGGLLVGVSQREVTGFYPAMVENLEEFESAVFGFFTEHVSGKFGPPDYTFDCYVTRDGRVKLIDFNPWGAFTLPLLFTWDDLERNYWQAVNGLEELDVGSTGRLDGDLGLNFEELSLNSEGLGPDRMDLNWKLKERGHKLDFRVVERAGCVQPSLRASSGVPYDYIDTSPGSAWDEFLRRADEEIKKQASAPAAGG